MASRRFTAVAAKRSRARKEHLFLINPIRAVVARTGRRSHSAIGESSVRKSSVRKLKHAGPLDSSQHRFSRARANQQN
jgi:hypothetical protein